MTLSPVMQMLPTSRPPASLTGDLSFPLSTPYTPRADAEPSDADAAHVQAPCQPDGRPVVPPEHPVHPAVQGHEWFGKKVPVIRSQY